MEPKPKLFRACPSLIVLAATLGAVASFGTAQPTCGEWTYGTKGPNSRVNALIVFDDGTGPALVAGGEYQVFASRRVGNSWTPMFLGLNQTVWDFAIFDDGITGPSLYAGGLFNESVGGAANSVARWDGASWRPLGNGIRLSTGLSNVFALAIFDDGSGSALYAAGDFDLAGGAPAANVARWDGTGWSPVSAGLPGYLVRDLTVYDDGGGPALYAAIQSTSAGLPPAEGLFKWDGVSWTPISPGPEKGATALAVFDDGTGPGLYVGGASTSAGGVAAYYVARWDGSAWTPLGNGLGYHVMSLGVADDGYGPALYVGGRFITADGDGVSAPGIAKWDGHAWSSLGTGISYPSGVPWVSAIVGFDDGSGPAVYAGGNFSLAGGRDALYFAEWKEICALALRGGVNAGPGPVTDVLFLNGSAGGRERKVSLRRDEALTMLLFAPPIAAGGPAPFALYLWAGEPTPSSLRRLPRGLGYSSQPMPFTETSSALRVVWNNTGRTPLGAATLPSVPAPSGVLSLNSGTGRAVTVFLQGVIRDRGTGATVPWSITNGITLETR